MLPGRYQDSVAVIGEGSQERGSQVSVIGGRNGNEKEESFLPLPPFEQREGWGNLLGIDRSYLSEIETGTKDPSLRVLKVLADGFKLGLSEFLRGL